MPANGHASVRDLLRRVIGPASRRARTLHHVLDECNESVTFQGKRQVREHGTLHRRRQQDRLVSRAMKEHERTAGRQRNGEELGTLVASELARSDDDQWAFQRRDLTPLGHGEGDTRCVPEGSERL